MKGHEHEPVERGDPRFGIRSIREGDVPAVLAVFSDEITWHVPGRSPLAGDYAGHDEVVGFFQALGERSNGTFHLEVHDILDNGKDTVVVLVTEHAERNGSVLAASAVHVWRFRNGKAASFQNFDGDNYELDEFWS
jgi:ketosteroid isomerase-like protein